jgi:hypothetical protein
MIYFIKAGKSFVKIGNSTDTNRRLNELKTGNMFRLKVLGHMPGCRQTESELHRIFDRLRKEGEWFSLTGHLQACIEALHDSGRKHKEVKTVRQFLENGYHLQCRRKMNRVKKRSRKRATSSAAV